MDTTSQTTPSRIAVFSRVLAVTAAFLAVGLLVIAGSRAAFTDLTDNSSSALAAGTVVLNDDDTGSAMFNVSGMVPGQSEVRCILVTYSGTVADPAAVKLYSGGYVDSGNFADFLTVTIEEGTGGLFGDCSSFVFENTIEPAGTLAGFDGTHTSYATGAGVWDPAATPESKAYRFTLELDSATPDTEQGESVSALIFTWEVQS